MIIQILYVSNKVNSKVKNTFHFTKKYFLNLFVKKNRNKIIFEKSNENVIYYIRSVDGRLIGFKCNNDTYYYI